MKKRTFVAIQMVLGLFTGLYFVATLYCSDFWGNILSPIGALGASGILFYNYSVPTKRKKSRLLLALACFSWAVADILWAFYSFVLNTDPMRVDLFRYMYLPASVLIAFAIGANLILRRRDWDSFQLISDIVSIGSCSLILIWIIFFDNNIQNFQKIDFSFAVVLIPLLAGSLSLSGLTAEFNSFSDKKPLSKMLMLFGILVFVLVDAYCSYQDYFGLYRPNSIVDFVYLAAMLVIADSSLIELYRNEAMPENNTQYTYVKYRHRGVFLLVGPVIVLALHHYDLVEILLLLTISVAYDLCSSFIYSASRRNRMLQQEQLMNGVLVNRIQERTRQLEQVNEQLDSIVNRDALTSLLSRDGFIQTLEGMLGSPNSNSVVLFFCGLDRFKAINDAYGHDVGDLVLSELGHRLNGWNQKKGIMGRMGSDEFVFGSFCNCDSRAASETAQKLIACCGSPIVVNSRQIQVTVSIGISYYPEDTQDCRTLLKNGEIAMHHAKRHGCRNYMFFNPEMNRKAQRETDLEMLLRQADYQKEFELYYQPQFRISDRKLIGAEALIRWNSPEMGRVMPNEFIPLAEETGVIVPLGEWILKTALLQIKEWNIKYGLNLKVGVNVSFKQLDELQFASMVKSTLHSNAIAPEWVDLEITESVAMQDERRIHEILTYLSNAGISFSIDDFGTGYSSFASLKCLPIDRIKIAKPMVDNISGDIRDEKIAKVIILMAEALNIQIIAEGVEDQEQLGILKKIGCDQIQGYLWGRPAAAVEFEQRFLEEEKGEQAAI